MKVRDVMTRNVDVVQRDQTLQQAAEKMGQVGSGVLPVCDGERLVGMVTDRDITVRATSEGLDPAHALVGEIMSAEVVFCSEDQDVKEAARLMEDEQIRRLPVLDGDMRLAGIVSLGDLSARTGNKKLAGEVLEQVSQPPPDDPHPNGHSESSRSFNL